MFRDLAVESTDVLEPAPLDTGIGSHLVRTGTASQILQQLAPPRGHRHSHRARPQGVDDFRSRLVEFQGPAGFVIERTHDDDMAGLELDRLAVVAFAEDVARKHRRDHRGLRSDGVVRVSVPVARDVSGLPDREIQLPGGGLQ